MPVVPESVVPYLTYATPPVLGAFIGYLTNRVAIRMLFRPLKAWKVFGMRVPMTPGVIPSKRHDLAVNIGEMVGEHLLTSTEVGKALKKEKFQNHLYSLIEGKVETVLQKELGPLHSLVPEKFTIYFDLAVKTVVYQIKEGIHNYIHTEQFTEKIEGVTDGTLDALLATELNTIMPKEDRQTSYSFLEESIGKMVHSPAMEQTIDDFVHQKIHTILNEEKSAAEILPPSLQELLYSIITDQTPQLLEKFAHILSEPEIRDKVVAGAKEGVQKFIDSLGPMAAMVHNFLSMDMVEEKVREYLVDKEEDIVGWLQNEEVQQKVSTALQERAIVFMNTPLVDFIKSDTNERTEEICATLSRQLVSFLREPQTIEGICRLLQDNIEIHIENGNATLQTILNDLIGEGGLDKGRAWIKSEGIAFLRSAESKKTLDSMVELLLSSLLARNIGKLSNLLPQGVREGMYRSIQNMSSEMLATEVPGLVDSLDLRNIVAEKVDSLNLLRLEELLLSIMEEQFKYINLFGGLLGFMIGMLNLIVFQLL